jgi:2-iminobutanoate/2-iminopropanoate deaminase
VTREVIRIPDAPERPYSPAIRAGDYIFVSGQVGTTDDNGNAIEGIEEQTKRCLDNASRILEIAGSSLTDVVKTTVFITDVADFAKMNEVYQTYFPKDRPARSTIVTGLVNAAMVVEIEFIAYCPGKG